MERLRRVKVPPVYAERRRAGFAGSRTTRFRFQIEFCKKFRKVSFPRTHIAALTLLAVRRLRTPRHRTHFSFRTSWNYASLHFRLIG